jgi:hypothetical protein
MCGILNWLHNQDKMFYAGGGISILPGHWKKYVGVKGEHLEIE